MTLVDISIKKPVFAWMMMLFLIVFGGICWWQMGVSQMPDVDFPTVQVTVELEGASPEIVESDVIDPIEDAIMSVQGVKEIRASARHGRASLDVEFELDRNIDVAVQEIQTKIAQAQRLLPRDIDPPIVQKSNADDQTIMWIAFSGHVPYQDLLTYARYHLRDRLQTVKGVGDILMGGYRDRNMRLWLKQEEMRGRELAVDDVLAAIRREHVEVPAGRIESGTREMNVRSLGEAPSAEQFRKLVVAWRNGAPVTLEQIAVVEDGLADRRRLARTMGVPAVGMGIKKQYGSNAVEVARGVRARVEELRKHLPPGTDLEVNSDSTVFVEESIQEIQFTLVLSILLTSVVCWLFLGSWTSTFNILLAIPTSIVGSFIFMQFMGFTLNTFTLLALSLAVGIVVDDAIMVLENIVRHREKGEGRVAAASLGAREITLAAMAATVAIIAIFLPIAFVRGLIGKFLYQFGVTLSVAVALSLLEALTLTPMRCSQMLSVGGRSGGVGGLLDRVYAGLARAYRATLRGALRWSVLVLLAGFFVFAVSIVFLTGVNITVAGRKIEMPPLRQEIVPAQDQSMIIVRLQTPVGSSVDYTDEKLQECERYLAGHGAVLRYFSAVGGFGGGEVDTGIIFMTLKPPKERPGRRSQTDIMGELRGRFNAIPGLKAYVSDLSMRAFTGRGTQFPIEFAVTGPEWNELGAHVERIMERMRETGLLLDVNSDYLLGMPELQIPPEAAPPISG
jgi:multidrug efflux pump subunit AcrB